MLEHGESLRTWALELSPAAGMTIAAEALPDHRKIYLEYEGPVSGDRGAVTKWDQGTYCIVSETSGELTIQLDGERLIGRAILIRDARDAQRWSFGWTPA